MDFFKKIKTLPYGYLLEVAGLCATMALLILLAVFLAGGGAARVGNVITTNGISPSSQTADIFPCSWFGDCGYASKTTYGVTANTTTVSPGQAVTLSWVAYSTSYGYTSSSCMQGYPYGSGYNCSLTGVGAVGTQCAYTPESSVENCTYDSYGIPTCTTTVTPANPCSNILSAAPSGSAVVYPSVTTTYTFCGTMYYGTRDGSNFGWFAFPTPCPSATVTVVPPAPTCTLTPPTQSVTLPTSPSITYSTTNATAVSYAVDGVARGAPAGNPFTPIGATTVGSHNVIMTVSGAGGTATCGSNGNVVVNAQGATSCTLSPASQNVTNMQSANFTYTNPNANTTTYSVDGGAPVTVTGGSFSVPPGLSVGTHSIQLQVTNTTNSSTCGSANNVTTTAAPLPTVSVTAGGASSVTINPNATTDLVWSTSGATPGSASLTAPSNSSTVTNLGSITGASGSYYFSSFIVAGGYIYEMGGYNGSAWVNSYWRIPVGSDIAVSAWSSLGTLPASVNASISDPVVIGSNIYIFGGYNATQGYNYNICTAPVATMGTPSSWSCPATLPQTTDVAKTFSYPVIIGDYVYRFGGYNNATGGVASVARAPLSSPTSWTNYPNVLPAALYGQGIAVVGNYVYLLGGYSSVSGTLVNTIYRALITSDLTSPSSWTSGGVMPVPGYLHGVAVDANNMYLIGGYVTSGVTTAAIYKLPLTTLSAGGVTAGSWTSAGALPVAMYPVIPFIDGDKLYMAGGYSASAGYVNQFYKASFNNGLPYTSSANSPWHTDGGNNSAITWPLTVPSVTYTLRATNPTGESTSMATVNKPDLCTNAPFTGIQNPLPSGVTAVGTTCSCVAAGTAWDGSTCSISLPTISSFSGPLRVRSGNTAPLSYTVVNPTATCSITANGAPMATISPVSGVPGTLTTDTITANTVFTLTCGGSSRSTSVGITPVFQEQ